MKIEILYVRDCPYIHVTTALVQHIAVENNLDASIRMVEVKDARDAKDRRFLGSPTVRVNDVDIEPSARQRTEYNMDCRCYGTSGIPPRGLIEYALKSA